VYQTFGNKKRYFSVITKILVYYHLGRPELRTRRKWISVEYHVGNIRKPRTKRSTVNKYRRYVFGNLIKQLPIQYCNLHTCLHLNPVVFSTRVQRVHCTRFTKLVRNVLTCNLCLQLDAYAHNMSI